MTRDHDDEDRYEPPPPCHRAPTDSDPDRRAVDDQHDPGCFDRNRVECPGCKTCPEPHCAVDRHRHLHPRKDGPRTCTPCVEKTSSALGSIRGLAVSAAAEPVAAVYGSPGAPRNGPRSSETPVVGGNVAVMMGPGGTGTVVSSKSGNRDHAGDHHRGDPDTVIGLLAAWEDDWRHDRHEPAAGVPNLATVLRYLTEHLGWAAQRHDAFRDFAADVRRIRGALLSAIGDSPAPERNQSASCVDCGGRLVAHIGDAKPCPHKARPARKRRPVCALPRACRRRDDDGHQHEVDVCQHDPDHDDHWPDGWEPLHEFDARMTAWVVEHARCDQGGREDVWECGDCGREYTPSAYFMAVRARLEAS